MYQLVLSSIWNMVLLINSFINFVVMKKMINFAL